MRSQALGRYGEDLAVRYLQQAGLIVIARNWRCRAGELDVIALSGDDLVICEVKTRANDTFGGPIAAITPAKLNRLRRLAGQWLQEHPIAVRAIRIDVIAVMCPVKGAPQIEHLLGVE